VQGSKKYPKVIIIATNQALDNDAQIRRRMASVEKAQARRTSAFQSLDLGAMQMAVNRNLLKLLLQLEGRYLHFFDLLNYIKDNRRIPRLTPENAEQYYTLANSVTLNGIYLYQYLKGEGFEPHLIQNYATGNLTDLLKEKPLAVCLSSNFVYMDDIREMAERVKQLAPEVAVIAGGMLIKRLLDPGDDLSPKTLKFFASLQGKVDAFVVEALGEQTLVKLLHCINRGHDAESVPNLALFDSGGNLFFTPRLREHIPIDRTVIAWDRVPEPYLRRTLPVNTSRGCAYRCRFCTYHWMFPQVRFKSLDALTDEMRRIQGLGFVKHVRFTDDNFTANGARLKSVLQMMIREKFDFTWSSYARASAVTPDLVALMRRSGCEFLDFGIESGSQTILDLMDKRLQTERALEAIRFLNDNGICSRGTFIVGYPGETEKTFAETVDFINESGLTYYHPYLFSYSKRSLVHRDRERYGLRGIGLTWRHNTMDSVQASELMARMIRQIDRSYTDEAHIVEMFKLLRGEGYGPEQILDLFRLKRELQLAVEVHGQHPPFAPEVDRILSRFESAIRGSRRSGSRQDASNTSVG